MWEPRPADGTAGQAPPPEQQVGYGPPPPGYAYPSPYGYPPAPQPSGTNGLAIASLVTSLLGFVFPVLPAVLAIIFGFVSLSQINKSGQGGRGMAIAGIVIGFLWVALYVVLIGILVFSLSTFGRG